jgi:hypothetical protein
MKQDNNVIEEELLISKIYIIRGHKVMLDRDLAELYQVETKRLNEQVKRNLKRFPLDFMFQLTENEDLGLRSQIATSKKGRGGQRYLPMVFTEHGVLMLSSVLSSEKAIEVNIQIMRIFTKIRQILIDNTDIQLALERLGKKTDNNTKNIDVLFRYFDELIAKEQKPRKKIGYKL